MKTYVINLKKRKDKLNYFLQHFPSLWPYDKPIVYEAVDGCNIEKPGYWTGDCGALGCYLSHKTLIKKTIDNHPDQDLLIFEDDALFVEDFVTKFHKLINNVPQNWDMIYLGGEHKTKPISISSEIYLNQQTVLTHGYMIKASSLPLVYEYLDTESIYRDHIDWHYSNAHRYDIITAYSPTTWLIGQKAGWSDVQNKVFTKDRWYNYTKNNKEYVLLALTDDEQMIMGDKTFLMLLYKYNYQIIPLFPKTQMKEENIQALKEATKIKIMSFASAEQIKKMQYAPHINKFLDDDTNYFKLSHVKLVSKNQDNFAQEFTNILSFLDYQDADDPMTKLEIIDHISSKNWCM
jgi:GR25 family glycosyltransferase involved in LPS biosynthesis